jgi:hypothetical protein
MSKTFYIAGQPSDEGIPPLLEGCAVHPGTADMTATRPTTANSLLVEAIHPAGCDALHNIQQAQIFDATQVCKCT